MTQERRPLERAGKAALEKDAGHWGFERCSGWGRGTGTGCAGVMGGYHVEKESGEHSGVRFCYERDRRSELELGRSTLSFALRVSSAKLGV